MSTQHRNNIQSPLHCFLPTAGIFTGIFFGWIVHLLLPKPVSFSLDLAARTLELVVGLIGWAIGTAIYGKQIHCGGSQKADKSTRERYILYAPIVLIPLIILPILLVKELVFIYFGLSIILLAMISGEIGWGDPLRLLRGKKNEFD